MGAKTASGGSGGGVEEGARRNQQFNAKSQASTEEKKRSWSSTKKVSISQHNTFCAAIILKEKNTKSRSRQDYTARGITRSIKESRMKNLTGFLDPKKREKN